MTIKAILKNNAKKCGIFMAHFKNCGTIGNQKNTKHSKSITSQHNSNIIKKVVLK